MRHNLITKTVAGAALLFMVGAGLACSNDADASESAYCKTAREWAVHELTPVDNSDPAAFKAYWQEYTDFVDDGVRLAPSSIEDDWAVYEDGVAVQTAVFEKYDYDGARFEESATDDEQAALEPTPAQQNAQDAVLRYEALVCSSGQPPAADVSFANEKPGAYCDVVAKDAEQNEALREAGFSKTALKAAYNDSQATEFDQQFVDTAPKVIADDVKAVVRWWDERQAPVVKRYGFDFRKILLEGSPQERADFQLTDEKIRDQFARTIAYEEQVCGQ